MFALMNQTSKVLYQDYRKDRWSYRKVAQKYADRLNRYRSAEDQLVVISLDDYRAAGYNNLTRKVVNLMTGQEVEESINTPNCCSVSSETYWSM